MANESVSREQVKSIVNELECSPSKGDSKGPNMKPSTSPGSRMAKGVGKQTSAFKMSSKK